MKIISYNVNGIRAALKKGLADWLKQEDPDVFCIQESKIHESAVPMDVFTELGYHQVWHSAEKKGYSGVATFSKKAPASFTKGMGMEKYDLEGRVLRTDFEGFSLLNCYFPSGSSSEERHQFKMEFLQDFRPYVEKFLAEKKKLIVLGDYNIVHLDYDIHNPDRRDKPSGFRPEERSWMDDWFNDLFVDTYRFLHPDEKDIYSWWSYRAGSRQRNKGWRIDYISVTPELKDSIVHFQHRKDDLHSDHCALILDLDL
jgi:exodeoxyribonuclease-3